MTEHQPGIGVDAQGGAVVDPTKNVLDLVDAAVRRVDDLAELRADHAREIDHIRTEHARELRKLEADRIDAIREKDSANVQRAATEADARAQVLAAQVVAVADPLRADIADLRRSQYEAQGSKDQTTESRLTTGTVIALVSLAAVLILGVASIVTALIVAT